MTDDQRTKRGGTHVYDALVDAGIDLLVGLPGTQTLPLDRTVTERDEMQYVMARHETAIPHIAWGYYEACHTPAATLTVPGPGDTNAMHGLKNARDDYVPIVHVSADVNPAERGKRPIHEIDADTFDNAVKTNVTVERPLDLPAEVARGLETAFTPPTGPVRLGVPSEILDTEFAAPTATVDPERTTYETGTDVTAAVDRLAAAERPVVYLGVGARRSAEGSRVATELVQTLNAPMLGSYKGKGVVPEDDPRWIGTSAGHLNAGARRVLESADVVLALGTAFDGVSTSHWSLPMGETLIHVTPDRDLVDRSYEADISILDDVTAAGDALLAGLADRDSPGTRWDGARVGSAVREEYLDHLHDMGLFDGSRPANTPEALTTIRDIAPEETVVATDVGGFRLWAKQVFEATGPERYITAGSWAGMGVGLPAAIGAKLARPDRPVVCLHGDGGLMMCIHELHTAAEENLDLTTVVFNNRDYGIISKSPKIREYTDGHEFTWGTPDFASIAEGFGCRGTRAEDVDELREVFEEAMAHDGPDVIDLAIETDEPSAVDAAEYESTVDLS